MVTWERIDENYERSGWDPSLLCSRDGGIFQSYVWGEFKRRLGWTPMRWLATDRDGSVVAMAQVLMKSLGGGIKIGWVPGGPALLFPKTECHNLISILGTFADRMRTTEKCVCLRFYSQIASNSHLADCCRGWYARPRSRLNAGYSILMDLSHPMDVLTKRMTQKHRYYVKKALAENIQWTVGRDACLIEELARLHDEMTRAKGLHGMTTGIPDLEMLCRVLGGHATILTGRVGGSSITACLVLTFGQKAFYMMAATGAKGRMIGASYAMVYQLFQYLQGQGIQEFDFGGLDPASPAMEGVGHFKRGFGGELVEYLGEWEWASAQWLRWGVNFAIQCRKAWRARPVLSWGTMG